MVENLTTLLMLILLQAVLGFDNLLYISLASKRAPKEHRSRVRMVGIVVAVVLRIVLLFVLMKVIELFQDPFLEIHWGEFMDGVFNVHAFIVLGGGAFILYTAMKEIAHMMTIEEHHENVEHRRTHPPMLVIGTIVMMNLVFSFDSILSAMALSEVFWVMAAAIIIGGALMILLADYVSDFLQKNRMYEVLGLFILFVVGIMLLTEGGHLAHLHFFGREIVAMSKTTFYFVIGILVLTDVVQGRYQRKLMKQKAVRARSTAAV